jgi:hypothetical protein
MTLLPLFEGVVLGCFFGLGFEVFVDCGEKRLEMVKNGVKW